MLSRLPLLDPALSLQLPSIPTTGNLKPVEDEIDAVLCAYIAAHWWFWATQRNRVYGCGGRATSWCPSARHLTRPASACPHPISHADLQTAVRTLKLSFLIDL
jgi:predicted RNase H-like nuclease